MEQVMVSKQIEGYKIYSHTDRSVVLWHEDDDVMPTFHALGIEQSFNAIRKWYDGEWFQLTGVSEKAEGVTGDDCEQSDSFLSVHVDQRSYGEDGDGYQGEVYFEFEKGKFLVTHFVQ